MRSPVADLLADLASALDDASVAWYLFGAQAAILHGAARLTADVDVTVRLPETMSQEMLAARIEQHGFRRRTVDPAFVERTRVIPFVHAPTTGRGKDLDDVAAILAAYGKALDVGYVRRTLALLEQALGQSDLLPTFEQLVARTRSG